MYRIEETGFGLRITFEGFLRQDEMKQWVREFREAISTKKGGFGVLVDNRKASVFPADAQEALYEGIHAAVEAGMEKNAVVVSNPINKIQADRIAKETGIHEIIRHIDASSDPDWERKAVEWITKGVNPD